MVTRLSELDSRSAGRTLLKALLGSYSLKFLVVLILLASVPIHAVQQRLAGGAGELSTRVVRTYGVADVGRRDVHMRRGVQKF